MSKIDLTIHKEGLAHNIQKAKENNIIIPTLAQMQNPDLIPETIKEKLTHTGLWDVDPVNLFRISWHNEAKESGGLYQKTPNYVERDCPQGQSRSLQHWENAGGRPSRSPHRRKYGGR